MSRDSTRPAWADELEACLGGELRAWVSIAGGDIAASFRAELGAGERVFVKSYGPDRIGIAAAEARGLAWLSEAGALRTPAVLGVGGEWLALEWIESARPAVDFAEQLGVGLARLHAAGAERFGLAEDNWIGRLPQCNAPHADWASFYTECRLRPLQRRAVREGRIPADLERRLDRLIDELPERVGPDESPARLHGDLWSGNRMVDERGSPCLIDPAVYGGHREIDLAMMRLFGGFDRETFEAYEAIRPLAPGAEARRPLYQIYPLLVHVCLFGRGYLEGLARAIEAALSPGKSAPAP